jgi:hypothetical protein
MFNLIHINPFLQNLAIITESDSLAMPVFREEKNCGIIK